MEVQKQEGGDRYYKLQPCRIGAGRTYKNPIFGDRVFLIFIASCAILQIMKRCYNIIGK